MAKLLTIDASVLVSAISPAEVEHETSVGFFEALRATGALLVLPTLVRPEVAGAIARTTGSIDWSRRASRLAFLPVPATFVPLDDRLAADAAELAAGSCLRGADAVYAAVAQRFDTVLVTLDRELRQKLSGSITCRLPQEL